MKKTDIKIWLYGCAFSMSDILLFGFTYVTLLFV